MINKGYLTADKTTTGDSQYTPSYAVLPLLEFLPIPNKNCVIWCPFDDETSEYVKILKKAGFTVIATDIEHGYDFFEYTPDDFDIIISNPPFSLKDKILKRLNELGCPYAMLLPLPTLQGEKRFDDLNGVQALIFDKRINFYKDKEHKATQGGAAFASIYICKHFLPQNLIFRKLDKKGEK